VAEPFRIGADGVERAGAQAPARATRPAAPAQGASFGDVLAGKLQQPSRPVTFSGHALQRLERRGIALDDRTLARLNGGVDRAAAKGSRSSVVLVDDSAFVVSVPNRTVITAVDREHMKDQVFTNIDSAVIA
jgi:flagellar operon protein